MGIVTGINVSQVILEAQELLQEKSAPLPEKVCSTIRALINAVTALSDKLNTTSRNSSIPPSQDPNRGKKKRMPSKGEKRKPGAQVGHEGRTLKRCDDPDEIIELNIDRRTVPRGFYRTIAFETRQVFDIEILMYVTEYQAEVIENEAGETYVACFPEAVTQAAQYGNATKATSVYLSQSQLVPQDRVRQFFEDQVQMPLSKGSVGNFNYEAYEKLEFFETWAGKQLIKTDLLHADETGINIGGKKYWLHCLSSNGVTLYHPDEKRGTEAMERMGVLPHFKGILCHDHWKPYFTYSDCLHALCNAHHLRELEWAIEEEKQGWAKKMMALLLEINQEKTASISINQDLQKQYLKRYQDILAEGDKECPKAVKVDGKKGPIKQTKSRNLLERLTSFEKETLRFMRDPRVPFTNNQGERDIRMTKVQQKISGCFRSVEGAKIFCRIRSYLSTCLKNGVNHSEALRMLFDGKIPHFMI